MLPIHYSKFIKISNCLFINISDMVTQYQCIWLKFDEISSENVSFEVLSPNLWRRYFGQHVKAIFTSALDAIKLFRGLFVAFKSITNQSKISFREPEDNILDPILIQQFDKRMSSNPDGFKRGRKPKTSNEKPKPAATGGSLQLRLQIWHSLGRGSC